MPNTLSAYNPIFYANEGLEILQKALGMANRVYRGYDDAQSTREYGDTITIRVPGSFTAQDAPSTAQDVVANSLSMKLNQWKEVKFSLTDQELSYSKQRIIEEHITPAVYALADKVDQTLCALWKDVPWYTDWTSPAAVADITTFRAAMFNNKVDFSNPAKLHSMVNGTIEGELLALSAFSQNQGAGALGVETQLTGNIGRRYGFEFFANQNVASGTSATVADLVGAVNNGPGYVLGATSILVNGFTANAQFTQGDIVKVTGHTQQYVLTADALMDGGGAGTLVIYGSPLVALGGLEAAVTNAQVVTVVLAGGSGTTKAQTMAFHEGAFALGVAKLPDFMDGQGIKVASILDPKTKLSLRARTWADGQNSKFYIAFDILFGTKTIDGNKAIRNRR